MTDEIITSRTIKGWSNDFIIEVIKEPEHIRVKETHTGSVPNTRCVEVVISLSEMNFTWQDRIFKTRSKVGFTSHISLFQAAEDVFIKLLSQHLKYEYNGEKLGQRNWRIIRRDVHVGLRQFVPKKEADERIARRNRESVLRGLNRARNSAEINHYPHIATELTRLIEEVKG
jgi:hypothetical protein